MNYSLVNLLSLIGSLALFIYGIKLLGQALQKIAGDRLRKIFNTINHSRVANIFTGFFISSAVQTSSSFSVMMVSFVNAGIISLIQAIGVIMGAGVGSTVKIWIITLVGLGFSFGSIGLPLLAITFPLIFSKKIKRQIWGELMVGIALLFIGINLIQYFIPSLKQNLELFSFVMNLQVSGFLSVLLFIFIGLFLTAIVRSSSAIVIFAIVLSYADWLTLSCAAAIILGANIGTTITPLLAARSANIHAKRLAFSHLLIKILGVCLALIFFSFTIQFVDFITASVWGTSPVNDYTAIPFALSFYHSAFNILNTVFLIGWIPFIALISEKIFKPKNSSEEEFSLKYIGSGFSFSEFSLLEVQKDLPNYAILSKKMFDFIPLLLLEKDKANYAALFNLIKTYEDKIDTIDEEIATYLNKVSQGELSEGGIRKIKSMLRISKEIENIADCSYHMANRINQKNEQNTWFVQEMRNHLKEMFDVLNMAFEKMIENLQTEYDKVSIEEPRLIELQINKIRNELLEEHFLKTTNNEYSYLSGLAYFDLISTSEKIGDHLLNINEAIVGLK